MTSIFHPTSSNKRVSFINFHLSRYANPKVPFTKNFRQRHRPSPLYGRPGNPVGRGRDLNLCTACGKHLPQPGVKWPAGFANGAKLAKKNTGGVCERTEQLCDVRKPIMVYL